MFVLYNPCCIFSCYIFRDIFFRVVFFVLCVCNWYTGCLIRPNYEVVGFQPQSVTTKSIYDVSYCYVPLTHIPCFYSRLPDPGIRSRPHHIIMTCLNITPTFHLYGVLRPGIFYTVFYIIMVFRCKICMCMIFARIWVFQIRCLYWYYSLNIPV